MSFDVLVLSDLRNPSSPAAETPRNGNWARLFYRKALRKLQHENITPGLIVLFGDLLADASDADYQLALLAEDVLKDGIPVWAVPGAHDDAGAVERVFNFDPSARVVEGRDILQALEGVALPKFCEAPFAFLHVRLDGAEVTRTVHQLQLPAGLSDTHSHTAFAQCASGTVAAENQRLAEVLGLDALAITEHAFQLYFAQSVSWSFKWIDDPAHAEAAWRTPGRGRMRAYQNFIRNARRGNTLIGLECDLYDNGKLLLHPEDAAGWDLFLGAMHRIQGAARGQPPGRIEALFMRDLRALLSHPIDILAHPLRIFGANNVPDPVHLFDDIARLLAEARVAAEINFHNSPPHPAFFTACLRRGVLLSLGTDTHTPAYSADLHPHVRFLAELGVTEADLPRVLLDPRKLPRRT